MTDTIDRLAPQAETWRRVPAEPASIQDVPQWWRDLADIEEAAQPRKAAEYRQMASTLEGALAGRPLP